MPPGSFTASLQFILSTLDAKGASFTLCRLDKPYIVADYRWHCSIEIDALKAQAFGPDIETVLAKTLQHINLTT